MDQNVFIDSSISQPSINTNFVSQGIFSYSANRPILSLLFYNLDTIIILFIFSLYFTTKLKSEEEKADQNSKNEVSLASTINSIFIFTNIYYNLAFFLLDVNLFENPKKHVLNGLFCCFLLFCFNFQKSKTSDSIVIIIYLFMNTIFFLYALGYFTTTNFYYCSLFFYLNSFAACFSTKKSQSRENNLTSDQI